MTKIVGFGDSFVWGSEIANNNDGSLAWPSLVALTLNAEYETLAEPGCDNDAIARQIYHYFSINDSKHTLAVINWTWALRWDFYMANQDTWITLGPACVPEKLVHLVDHTQAQRVVDFYKDYANSSILWNKFRNLQTIFAVQQFLKVYNIAAVQTYMDDMLFSTEWHAPDYVRQLQNLVRPHMSTWDGKNFLDWCRARGHEITDPGWHPLASAHEDAASYWKETYAQALAR